MTSLRVDQYGYFLLCLLFFAAECKTYRRRRARPTRDEVPSTEINDAGCECIWTPWMNNDDYSHIIGDDTTYNNLRHLYNFCATPRRIQCREKQNWAIPFYALHTGGTVCNVTSGLLCVSRPYDPNSEEKPFYCDDYEITVQCCTCPTTTPVATTTEVPDVATTQTPSVIVHEIYEDISFKMSETNRTTSAEADDKIPLSIILICVFGCVVLISFIIIIWLLMSRSNLRRKKRSFHQDFYQEEPAQNYDPIVKQRVNEKKHKVAFERPNGHHGSSSDYVTSSSDDEGYRSRPKYSRRRKTKGERDRKLNGNRGNADDSFDTFQSLELRPMTESSDEGRFRKWFPDEYERSLQQKRANSSRNKIFTPPFNANNRKSIPYADDGET